MKVHGAEVSEKTLTNLELLQYVQKLKIPHFRGVFMRDVLPKTVRKIECGIMNLNTSSQKGLHWVCWYKSHKKRIYFDSFGQHVRYELERYLKTPQEFKNKKLVLERNVQGVQYINTSECGTLCLFVLQRLCSHTSYDKILYKLHNRYLQK